MSKSFRMFSRCLWLLLAFGLCWSSNVLAQSTSTTGFQLQRFRPWGDPEGMLQTQSGQTLGQWKFNVGILFNYGLNPFTARTAQDVQHIMSHQIGADIYGSLGLLSWLDVSLRIPMTIFQVGKIPDSQDFNQNERNRDLSGFSFSDIQLGLKAQILRENQHFVNLGLQIAVGFPSGNNETMNGEDGVLAEAALFVNKHVGQHSFALNLGYRYLPPTVIGPLLIQHELNYALGGRFGLVPQKFDLIAELTGHWAFGGQTGANKIPVELAVGGVIFPLATKNLSLRAAVSAGLLGNYGIPMLRVIFGVAWTAKTSDQDKDGVADGDDKCPKTPGPKENRGCPWGDTDKDGLKDNVDKCPNKVGPKENKGCPWPDTDGDGLTDNVDKCPKKKGSRENRGCPWGDRDGDGLKDNVDKCPDKAGPKENKGCPWPDTDGDGVLDKDDKCPNKKGPKKYQGCPDSDNDTVLDKDDKCPYVPGVKVASGDTKLGCPKVVLVQVTKKDIKILKKIFFRTGSARIRRRSFVVLDQVAQVMKSASHIKVRVEGHTDNVGDKDYNLRLSKERARSVYNYLVKKGISKDRLSSEGYGMNNPLVPNNSRKNRAKNRRVQFTIVK